MPIKLPKGFARRKSSGNALEEVENPPQSSFRVFERPKSEGRLFNGRAGLNKVDDQPLHSPTEDPDNIFAGTERPLPKNRGSGGTDRSAFTGGLYESSSTRFSSSSTLPSSADGPLHDNISSPHSRNFHDIPVPPLTSALRAAGRTFSFGGRLSKTSTPPPRPPDQSTPSPSRSRAMTTSTTSTATPPKLFDADLSLGKMADDFKNMFDGLGKQESDILEDSSTATQPTTTYLPASSDRSSTVREEKTPRPAPINTDRSKDVEPSPYSWDSRNSHDGLLSPAEDRHEDASSPSKRLPQSKSVPIGPGRKPLPTSNSMPITTTSHRSLAKPVSGSDKGLRRSVVYTGRRGSTHLEDEDARLVMESLYGNRRSLQPPAADNDGSGVHSDTSLFGNRDSSGLPQSESWGSVSTARAGKSPEPVQSQLDSSIAAHARLAARFEDSVPKSASPSNKVMTPSQFEHYRQQQELRRSNSNASTSEDSAESDYDEEDETEKNREAERQRRKQEAHLSVYRQRMMKVTGQQSPAPSLRPEMDRASTSTPTLTTRTSNPGNKSGSAKSSEGDEDDEIPLGILAAHGFPNRNRPPTRLSSANSIPNLRASFQPHVSSPGSAAGDQDLSNRNSLPVFARNLPRDPYLGASLVNPSNRESLALGGGASVYGGPAPGLPPGGLVGVIATEERARAMRRGSPNMQGTYDHRAGTPGMGPGSNGIPRPYTMMNMNMPGVPGLVPSPQPGLSPAEHAQLQLSQHMTNMMQMQMQWMQQMVQMQGGQGSPQPHMMQNLAPPMTVNTNLRPVSMPPAGPFDQPLSAPPQVDHRTLRMLDPNMSARWNGQPMSLIQTGPNRPGTPGGQGYAPSIAPSERSNIGMASRYRPVSTYDQSPNNRASTLMSSTSKPWNDENHKSTISIGSPQRPNLPKTTSMTTVTVRPISSEGRSTKTSKKGNIAASDDEDDDEAWAEMIKKREKKKSSWKMKRGTSSLGDFLSVVH